MKPMKNEIRCNEISVASGTPLYHVGPPLDYGPLPSLFYFALSGPDSLCLDPFNQPVQFLHGKMIRVFSMTLPGHENNLPATQAISLWAEDFSKGIDCIGNFLDQAARSIEFAIREKFADPSHLAVGGLSRGGFIAAHLAARDERFRFLLAFAPLTQLKAAKEFTALQDHPLVYALDLLSIAPSICNRHVRIYIGNHDTRVSTRASFDFAMALTEAAYEKKIRSPQIEMIISPSIGQMGHGTSPDIFRQGTDWLASCLTK